MVSPRDTSFMSGLTRCETEICVKPIPVASVGEPRFVIGIAVAMHQHDGAGAEAATEGGAQVALRGREIGRADPLAACAHALVHFDHFLVQHRGQLDVPHEQFRAVLVGDAQRIGEATRGDEDRAVALALEQRVGGHGRAHLHAVDEPKRAAAR